MLLIKFREIALIVCNHTVPNRMQRFHFFSRSNIPKIRMKNKLNREGCVNMFTQNYLFISILFPSPPNKNIAETSNVWANACVRTYVSATRSQAYAQSVMQ